MELKLYIKFPENIHVILIIIITILCKYCLRLRSWNYTLPGFIINRVNGIESTGSQWKKREEWMKNKVGISSFFLSCLFYNCKTWYLNQSAIAPAVLAHIWIAKWFRNVKKGVLMVLGVTETIVGEFRADLTCMAVLSLTMPVRWTEWRECRARIKKRILPTRGYLRGICLPISSRPGVLM